MSNKETICFLAVAIGEKHENFIVCHTISVLETIPDSFVEIIVRNKVSVEKRLEKEINILRKFYGDKFTIRETVITTLNIIPNTIRFIEEPLHKCDYTFISEIDVLILDLNLLQSRKKWMTKYNLCYSNIKRKDLNMLTGGRHCVKTKEYYNNKWKEYVKNNSSRGNDEIFLFSLCKIYGDYPNIDLIDNSLISCHGFHLSLNREPSKFNWVVNRNFFPQYDKLVNLCSWKEYIEVANIEMRRILNTLNQIRNS